MYLEALLIWKKESYRQYNKICVILTLKGLCLVKLHPSHQTCSHSVLKILSNGLELCFDKVDIQATFYNLFTNLLDRLGQ